MHIEHPFHPADVAPAEANRAARAAVKGAPLGVGARAAFDEKKMAIPARGDVAVEAGVMGDVGGFWCRPAGALPRVAILFLHGGGYCMGSARAFTSFAGQFASRAGVAVFAADYRLAPEHPFPAAVDDAIAAYRALSRECPGGVALCGDSAGGGLALSLAACAVRMDLGSPTAVAVMSPWTDLAMTGDSYATRADADPVFTREVLQDIANTYLGGADPRDPAASPLYAGMAGLPPVRIDVGDDELVLDDAVRYVAQARAAGVDASVHVWKGMPHVFQTGIGKYRAADESLDGIAAFLRGHLPG
jgi:acetyl esterase/lipase